MTITANEMRGILKGNCLPGDLRVNEEIPDYLARKFAMQAARIAELEVVNDLFLRSKALMYQSGGTPIENSLNPIDAWLYDAERAAATAEKELALRERVPVDLNSVCADAVRQVIHDVDGYEELFKRDLTPSEWRTVVLNYFSFFSGLVGSGRPAPVAVPDYEEQEATFNAGVRALIDCLEDCGDAEQGLRLALRACRAEVLRLNSGSKSDDS